MVKLRIRSWIYRFGVDHQCCIASIILGASGGNPSGGAAALPTGGGVLRQIRHYSGGGVGDVDEAVPWFRPSFCVRWLGRSPAVALEKPSPSAIKIEEVSSAAEAVAAFPAEATEEASSAAKSLAAVPAAEAIEEASFAAKLLAEVPSAEALAAVPAAEAEASFAAKLIAEVPAAVPAEAIEDASLAAKSLAEVRAAWIEKASSVAEVLEGVPAASFKVVSTSEMNIGLGDSSTALEVCCSANPGGGGGDLSSPVQVIACLPTGLQLLLNNICKLCISTCDPKQHPVLNSSSCPKQVGLELSAFLRRARMDPVFLKSYLQSDCEEFETQIYGMSAALIGCCLIGKEKQFDLPLLLFWEHTDPLIISVPRSNNPSGRQIALKDDILNESSFITVCVTLQMLMNGKLGSGKPRCKARITMVHFGGLHATVEIVLPTKLMVEHCLYKELIWEYIRAVHTSRLSGGAAKMPRTANWSPEADFYLELFRTQKFVRRVSSTELGAALVNKESNDNEISTQVITSYMPMDVIKKALASKQAEKTTLKMKKNALTVERSNHEYVGSSPHPRRLRSSGNQNTSESRLPINTNGRMISKLTLSRPNLATEHRGVYLPKSSVEDAEAGTNLIKFGSLNLKVHDRVTQEKNPYADTSFNSPSCSFSFSNQNFSQINVRTVEGPASKVHTKTSEGVPPEENTRCREVISHDDLRLMGNTNGRRPHFTTEHGSFRLLRLSLEDAKRGRKSESPNLNVHTKTFEDVPREEKKHNSKVSLENDPDATYNKAFSDLDLNHFCRSTCNSCCRGPLSKTTNRYRVSSRQSESIYWSGKPERLVSSDEIRKYHGPSGTSSSKFSRGSNIDRRSRTVDARSSWREQQAKDTQPLVNVSRIIPHGVLPGAPARLLTCDNVRREAEFYGETFSSLKFAQRVSAVEFCASLVNNKSTDAPDLEESVATNSPLSSTQNITNELADGQRILVLAAGSSKDLNNEAMRLSNGGMGCTEMLAENVVSHEQDSVPVRTVSCSLIEQLEALNIKARRVEAQKVNAQGGCDEKGKCAEVASGRNSSSGITSYDAQNAKMKERARQHANELQEEEERKRTQKTRAMVKLEELNMQRNNRDVPDQSKEQQIHHSYSKGSVNDSVPVRTVSRSLIEQVEALNVKARRVKAQQVNAQGGCDEKGKCAEVASGRDSSSRITFYDAQNAKMKERTRQRANELQEEEEERKRTQKARAMVKLEELNMRRNNRDIPDQSKEQQVHHSFHHAKGSVKKGNFIDARDQRQRNYCPQLSETAFSQSGRGVDIDRKLPMSDVRSNRMPSGKPTVGALPGSLPPRSRSFWIEKSSSEKAVSETPRKRSVWVEKTMNGRTAPTLPPRTTKSVWIEKSRNM